MSRHFMYTYTGLFDFLTGGSGGAPSASAAEAVEELLSLCQSTDGGAKGSVALREQIEEQVGACLFTGGSIDVTSCPYILLATKQHPMWHDAGRGPSAISKRCPYPQRRILGSL